MPDETGRAPGLRITADVLRGMTAVVDALSAFGTTAAETARAFQGAAGLLDLLDTPAAYVANTDDGHTSEHPRGRLARDLEAEQRHRAALNRDLGRDNVAEPATAEGRALAADEFHRHIQDALNDTGVGEGSASQMLRSQVLVRGTDGGMEWVDEDSAASAQAGAAVPEPAPPAYERKPGHLTGPGRRIVVEE